jgi:hypothetical protein
MLFWIYNRKQLLYAFLGFVLLFLSANFFINLNNHKSSEILIYSSRNNLILNVLNGKDNYLFADSSIIADPDILKYSAKPYWVKKKSLNTQFIDHEAARSGGDKPELVEFKDNFFVIGNARFMTISDLNLFNNTTDYKIQVDYVLLTDNVNLKIEQILDFVDFSYLIFHTSNWNWRIEKWIEDCDRLQISYFDMTSQGAFRVDFISKEIF